jgi:hypothetical protein
MTKSTTEDVFQIKPTEIGFVNMPKEITDSCEHLFNVDLRDVFNRPRAKGTTEYICFRGIQEVLTVRVFSQECSEENKAEKLVEFVNSLNYLAKTGMFHNSLGGIIEIDIAERGIVFVAYLMVYPEFEEMNICL